MRRATLFFLIAALPSAGCALLGYNFDGYGPSPSTAGAGGGGGAHDVGGAGGASGVGGAGGAGSSTGGGTSSSSGSTTATGAGGAPGECKADSECSTDSECKQGVCMGGVCHQLNRPVTYPCSNAGKCDGAGQCVGCIFASDCPVVDCHVPVCSGGQCSSMLSAPGMLCSKGVCDTSGNCTPVCSPDLPCPVSRNVSTRK